MTEPPLVNTVACPLCGEAEIVELADDWQEQVQLGYAIAIVGCGNPWHYRNLDVQEAFLPREGE